MYGAIEYDSEGNPKCEICGDHFKRVMAHVRQKHGINEKEYKMMFGLDSTKGICSKESSEKTRVKTLSNFQRCIKQNLIIKGTRTRKRTGDPGRTKDMVSAQTKAMLKEKLKNPKMVKAMKINGYKVGKSGLGNLKRWGGKNE
jgi:hypothetical protein